MKIVRVLVKGIVGLIFGILTALALSPFFASFGAEIGAGGIYAGVLVVMILTVFAPTIRRAFGRAFLALGACIFLLPVSTFFLSSVAVVEIVEQASDQEAVPALIGSSLGAGLMTLFAGFLGFFFGAIILLIGLVLTLGGRREVVVVKEIQ